MDLDIIVQLVGQLDWKWIGWRVIAPIGGPVLFTFLTMLIFGYVPKRDVSLRDLPFKRLWAPSAWLYYSITLFAFSCFEILDSGERQSWLFGASLICLILSLLVHAAFVEEHRRHAETPYIPPSLLNWIALSLAVGAAVVGYLAVGAPATPSN